MQELKESFNYGLFCPPENGKAGKFLDEERRLGDYPFNGPVGYLEVGIVARKSSSEGVVTAEVQKAGLQDDVLGREAAEEPAHEGQPAEVPGLRAQRASREDHEDVLEGAGSELPLPRLRW